LVSREMIQRTLKVHLSTPDLKVDNI